MEGMYWFPLFALIKIFLSTIRYYARFKDVYIGHPLLSYRDPDKKFMMICRWNSWDLLIFGMVRKSYIYIYVCIYIYSRKINSK